MVVWSSITIQLTCHRKTFIDKTQTRALLKDIWKSNSDWIKGPLPPLFTVKSSYRWVRSEKQFRKKKLNNWGELRRSIFFFTLKIVALAGKKGFFDIARNIKLEHTLYAALNLANYVSTPLLWSFPYIYIHILQCSVIQAWNPFSLNNWTFYSLLSIWVSLCKNNNSRWKAH